MNRQTYTTKNYEKQNISAAAGCPTLDIGPQQRLHSSQGLESVAKFILPFPRDSYHSNRWANLIIETEDNSLLKGLI